MRNYLGDDALKETIESFLQSNRNRNNNYDCILALSGGRDSTYLLYYIRKVLNLRVLSYSVDNGFIPYQTKQNLKNMADILNVKLVIEKNENLSKCIKHHFLSFIHKPSAPMIGLLCTGCRLMVTMFDDFVERSKVPVIISGGNPMDTTTSFKTLIMAQNPNILKENSLLLGYLFEAIKNPRWLLNYTCFVTQFKEYYFHFRPQKKFKNILDIAPYYDYIKWDEKKVVSTIKNELGWEENMDAQSSWRGDCDIALLKLYLYKKMLGFNDRDEALSYLIRDGQISRDEALERLEKEGNIHEKKIKSILDSIGLKLSDLKIALETSKI
ncbi:MAG: hypothetical protein IMY67_03690 [Bacteroidetes bacterium]|nr:hypothetical protein [Bacteroidota bacterium]